MADIDDDESFNFSDDGLDDLPPNTLAELERQAIVSTQQQQPAVASRPPPRRYAKPPTPRRLLVASRGAKNDAPRTVGDRSAGGTTATTHTKAQPPSSDYGLDEEDVIDLDERPIGAEQFSHTTVTHGIARTPNSVWGRQQESLQQAQNAPARHHQYRLADRSTDIQRSNDTSMGYDGASYGKMNNEVEKGGLQEAPAPTTGGLQLSDLQLRIQELEREKAQLNAQVHEARSLAQTKTGEVAIIRQKLDKTAREYEQKLTFTRNLHAEESAKSKAELEAARREREKVMTDNRFLEHDLAQETERAKQNRKTLKDGTGNRSKTQAAPSPAVTPKKSKALPLRDGFDDDDMAMLSPSKLRDKPKAATPKTGAKRKRLVADQSPGIPLPLPLSEPREQAKGTEVPDIPQAASLNRDFLHRIGKDGAKLEFVQLILNHKPPGGRERLFEALANFNFPSAPETRLSSLLFDQFAAQIISGNDSNLPKEFCCSIVSLWERCRREKYYLPLPVLIDAVQFIIDIEGRLIATSIIEHVLPVAVATSDIVAVPLGRAYAPSNHDRNSAPPQRHEHVDVEACLRVLQKIAILSATSSDHISCFWQHMDYDFVLVMLMKAQPLSQILIMLRLLRTSALQTSFGAIETDINARPERQRNNEIHIIDRITNLLFDVPIAQVGDEPYSPKRIANLRVHVLSVFAAVCSTSHGSLSLAQHRTGIGQLVRFLHSAIDAMYIQYPGLREVTVQSINISMRVLHHLITTHAELVDVKAKLSVVQNGPSKYLIALSRLAFAEMLVLEEGIEQEVSDAAHALLDEFLSPDEGEALLQLYPGSADR